MVAGYHGSRILPSHLYILCILCAFLMECAESAHAQNIEAQGLHVVSTTRHSSPASTMGTKLASYVAMRQRRPTLFVSWRLSPPIISFMSCMWYGMRCLGGTPSALLFCEIETKHEHSRLKTQDTSHKNNTTQHNTKTAGFCKRKVNFSNFRSPPSLPSRAFPTHSFQPYTSLPDEYGALTKLVLARRTAVFISLLLYVHFVLLFIPPS